MIYPILKELGAPTEKRVLEFKGYDVRNVIDPGAMRDMKNLTTDEYPCIYQRKQRGVYSDSYNSPKEILARREKLAVCDSTSFWYDGERKFDFTLEYNGERQLQAINTRIVIFPDKMFYNTETGEHGSLGAEVKAMSVAFHHDPTTYETCCTLTLALGADLTKIKKGDAISFRGLSKSIKGINNGQDNNISNGVVERIDYEENKLYFAEGVISYPTSDYQDFIDNGEDSEGFTILREIPDLDFIMEYNNRLYGCKGNLIYVCKLGDPTNWNYYRSGTADASYTVEVGTDGDFTGIAQHPTHIVFFKENCIHKLYGYKPSNYQLITTTCLGLEKGSHKSICSINGDIFYKSREGIMVYAGDIPRLISEEFGNDRYDSAVAGSDGLKYYVSMHNKKNDEWYFFNYDIQRGLWTLEDNTHAVSFAYLGNDLLYSDMEKNRIVMVVGNDENMDTDPIEWYAKFGDFDEFVENKKVYSKVLMRMKMEEDSQISAWISIDGGAWESIYHLDTHFKRTIEMPIVPRRCDRFAILITGKGYTKIESVTRIVREGTMK
jgi:hypothetical protein